MFGIFKRQRIPPRHRSSAYMDLAFGRTPTATDEDAAAWDTPPAPLGLLTDGSEETHLTTDGVDNDAKSTWIELDLGQEHEVYEINIRSTPGVGFMQAAAATVDLVVSLITGAEGEDVTTGTARDTQDVAHDGAWDTATIHYIGNGIPVRYVWIQFTPENTHNVNVDLSVIEVFGC